MLCASAPMNRIAMNSVLSRKPLGEYFLRTETTKAQEEALLTLSR
jgi:hypothetical protein